MSSKEPVARPAGVRCRLAPDSVSLPPASCTLSSSSTLGQRRQAVAAGPRRSPPPPAASDAHSPPPAPVSPLPCRLPSAGGSRGRSRVSHGAPCRDGRHPLVRQGSGRGRCTASTAVHCNGHQHFEATRAAGRPRKLWCGCLPLPSIASHCHLQSTQSHCLALFPRCVFSPPEAGGMARVLPPKAAASATPPPAPGTLRISRPSRRPEQACVGAGTPPRLAQQRHASRCWQRAEVPCCAHRRRACLALPSG